MIYPVCTMVISLVRTDQDPLGSPVLGSFDLRGLVEVRRVQRAVDSVKSTAGPTKKVV